MAMNISRGSKLSRRLMRGMAARRMAIAFTAAAAKHLANAMAYDDVIGVADLKIRSARFARIAAEMKAGEDPLYLTEFMHPRAEEMVSLLPGGMGPPHRREARPHGADRPAGEPRPARRDGDAPRLPAALYGERPAALAAQAAAP